MIDHTCVNNVKRMLANPQEKLAEKLAFDSVRETRKAFRFRLQVAKTETYNSSIVQMCVRVLIRYLSALFHRT